MHTLILSATYLPESSALMSSMAEAFLRYAFRRYMVIGSFLSIGSLLSVSLTNCYHLFSLAPQLGQYFVATNAPM